jgi:hypothetical protein
MKAVNDIPVDDDAYSQVCEGERESSFPRLVCHVNKRECLFVTGIGKVKSKTKRGANGKNANRIIKQGEVSTAA